MEELEKQIKNFILREYYENKLFVKAVANKNADIYKERNSNRFWNEGLKKYGKEWIDKEYEIRSSFYEEK